MENLSPINGSSSTPSFDPSLGVPQTPILPSIDQIDPLEENSLWDSILTVVGYVFAPFICIYECFWCCFLLGEGHLKDRKNAKKNNRPIRELDDFNLQTFQKDSKINWEVVKKPAPKLKLDFIRNVEVNLDQLPLEYDRLFKNEEDPAIRKTLVDYVKYAKQNTYIPEVSFFSKLLKAGEEERYFEHLRLILKNLIFELQSDDSSLPEIEKDKRLEKKKVTLISLSEAVYDCPTRRLEEPQRLLKRLVNREETVEEELLRFLESLKEEILLERCQMGQMHIINELRGIAGLELGLDRSEVNLDDISIKITKFTCEQVIHIFQKNFSEENVCTALKNRIIEDGKNKKYLEFLTQPNLLTQEELDKLADYTNPVYFNGKEITNEGVKLVLQKANLWPFN